MALLEVKNLTKLYKTAGGMLHAADGVSFTLEEGKTLGIVGESGCGKSTVGRCVLRLTEPTSGEILFRGEDLLSLGSRELREKRREMQIIFQDPFSSLDPRSTVSETIASGVRMRRGSRAPEEEVEQRVLSLMETVGIAERLYNAYPHELDGGRRQRIGIARALAVEPSLIVCDEPVSALDVSIQAQIINLLKRLQREMGLSYLFISHDLAVINHVADEVMVMYLGRVVEKGPAEELFSNPVHPYTRALISAVPSPKPEGDRQRLLLKGEVGNPVEPPDRCRFYARCPFAEEICAGPEPALCERGNGHFAACHRF